MKGCGVAGGRGEDKGGLWEGLERGVIWVGIERGRGKVGCALMVSTRVWARMDEYGWFGSRIVWMTVKTGMVKCAWVCVYAPVNEKGMIGKMKLEKFWKDLGELLKKFENDICAERGLFLSNTFFQQKMIHRYTWARGNERSLIDYIAVDNRLRREVEDTKVVRGLFSDSDHFAVLVAKVRMREVGD